MMSLQENDEESIKNFELIDVDGFKAIHITLKYGKDKNEKIISGLKRISKPGLRVYANATEIPKVLGGLGIAIVSTNKGVLTDKEANDAQRYLKLKGLKPEARYTVSGMPGLYSGRLLMSAGIPVPGSLLEYEAVQFYVGETGGQS